MQVNVRNIYFSLFAMACVLTVGGFFFRNTEVGGYLVPGIAFFGSLVLLDVLNTRDRRRRDSATASRDS
jgi:hypothetical protein